MENWFEGDESYVHYPRIVRPPRSRVAIRRPEDSPRFAGRALRLSAERYCHACDRTAALCRTKGVVFPLERERPVRGGEGLFLILAVEISIVCPIKNTRSVR